MHNQTDYPLILSQLEAMTDSGKDTVAILSNASAVLNLNLTDINWVGFYLVRNGVLTLGPFQGNPACVRIEFGKGVCGTAAAAGVTQLVADVHRFPGHIACDKASNSEIVVPLLVNGTVKAVLDIDSPLFGRFDEADRAGLERCAAFLAQACGWDD